MAKHEDILLLAFQSTMKKLFKKLLIENLKKIFKFLKIKLLKETVKILLKYAILLC